MTRENTGWLVAGLAVGLLVTMGAAQSGSGGVGRFQLVPTSWAFEVAEKGEQRTTERRDVFLIDTQLGTVVRLIHHDKTGFPAWSLAISSVFDLESLLNAPSRNESKPRFDPLAEQ